MSNVIAFLESLGRDAALRPAGEQYAAAVAALDVDDEARDALLAKDDLTLGALLGGRPRMLCALLPADDDQVPAEDQPAEDEPDDEKKTSIGLH